MRLWMGLIVPRAIGYALFVVALGYCVSGLVMIAHDNWPGIAITVAALPFAIIAGILVRE